MARYDIKGTTPRDIYNINSNFMQLSQEIFGNSDFTKTVEKQVKKNTESIEAVKITVGDLEGNYGQLIVDVNGINIEVGGKLNEADFTGNTIASKINLSSTTIKLVASKIQFEGLVTANNNFKILTDGSIETVNAKLTGEINSVDGSGRAVRIFNRNLVFYSPSNQTVRGVLSSSGIDGTSTEGLSVLLPKAKDSIFSVDRMSSFNDSTGVWGADKVLFRVRSYADGTSQVLATSDTFHVASDLTAPRAIQMGTISLNKDTATSKTFSTAMQGSPVIVLTPMHSITGAVVTAKLVSTSSTGFSAIIQGSPTSQNVTFYWIALT